MSRNFPELTNPDGKNHSRLIVSMDPPDLMFTEVSRKDIGRRMSSVSRSSLVAIYKSTVRAELFDDKPRNTDKCGKKSGNRRRHICT